MAKPIPLESYKCPKCDRTLFCSYEEAQKHVNISVDSPLPVGFVYMREGGDYMLVTGGGGDLSDGTHGHNQHCEVYGEKDKGSWHTLDSKDVKERLKRGDIQLLTEDQFKSFRKKYHEFNKQANLAGLARLVRKTPKLEQLAQSTA